MLLETVKKGDKREIARLITLIENNSSQAKKELESLQEHSKNPHIIGITGSPGSGKSSLISKLADEYQNYECKIGILAIDPSSPYSGGSILGDRVRMNNLFLDNNVFIRSMATRGYYGGLAKATYQAVRVLDATGYNPIFIETVGVGQTETDIMNVANTTVVIVTPEYGDTIQSMKAGILEIANIFVVNKSDHVGADQLVNNLKDIQSLNQEKDTPIYKTIATTGVGVSELREGIENHLMYLREQSN